MGIFRIIRRYWIVTCMPLLTATFIILDLNRTRNWKKFLNEQEKLKSKN